MPQGLHRRRSIRLPGYDYSQPGAYFVTIVVHERRPIFGEIFDSRMVLSKAGWIAQQSWLELPRHYPQVILDAFCVMPNHIHGIIVIQEIEQGARKYPLSEFARRFKSDSANRINRLDGSHGCPLWQRNYYEHIIRNEDELQQIRLYIQENPARWGTDDPYFS